MNLSSICQGPFCNTCKVKNCLITSRWDQDLLCHFIMVGAIDVYKANSFSMSKKGFLELTNGLAYLTSSLLFDLQMSVNICIFLYSSLVRTCARVHKLVPWGSKVYWVVLGSIPAPSKLFSREQPAVLKLAPRKWFEEHEQHSNLCCCNRPYKISLWTKNLSQL